MSVGQGLAREGGPKGGWAQTAPLTLSIPQVLALIQQKVVPTSEAVAPQSQELFRHLKEEAQHLSHVLLGPLIWYHAKG